MLTVTGGRLLCALVYPHDIDEKALIHPGIRSPLTTGSQLVFCHNARALIEESVPVECMHVLCFRA